jgi:hypothetical protein
VSDVRQSQKVQEKKTSQWINPLAIPPTKWYQFNKRIELFPWWLKYHLGIVGEARLRKMIIEKGHELGLQDRWMQRVIRHAVSEFSKQGLGPDYYGYHNISHELEATCVCLMAAKGHNENSNIKSFSKEDITYLFSGAIFHDYDPLKQFDKPHEDAVEWFIRYDSKIKKFIDALGINLEIVIALIRRTAYPFKGEIAEHATARMQELFTIAGIPLHNSLKRKHYEDLGWFLSVSERIAGYALGDFERAKELARRNAHALGWHPSLINEESVKYFSTLKEEREMFDQVINSIPEEYRLNYFRNVASFRELWEKEVEIASSIRKGRITLMSLLEDPIHLEPYVNDAVHTIYKELFIPIRINNEKEFKESLSDEKTILLTLRLKEDFRKIVGYVKGGPLERYTVRHGTLDENNGKNNTVFMEWTSIRPGYWGHGGGHTLRIGFLNEAKKRGYSFLTSYVHRDVLTRRINAGEKIKLVQKYDPDKLDYYRTDLKNSSFVLTETVDPTLANVEV